MLNWLFNSKKHKEIIPTINLSQIDNNQYTMDSVKTTHIDNDNRKVIIIMDDVDFMIITMKKAFENIMKFKTNVENVEKIYLHAKHMYDMETAEIVKFTLLHFDINNYNIIYFTGDKCGFEVIKSLENSDAKVDYAILDIILGGLIINQENEFESVDGLDVCSFIKKRDKFAKIMLNTGCSLNSSKEAKKLGVLTNKYNDIMIHIKGIEPMDRLIDILLFLSKFDG